MAAGPSCAMLAHGAGESPFADDATGLSVSDDDLLGVMKNPQPLNLQRKKELLCELVDNISELEEAASRLGAADMQVAMLKSLSTFSHRQITKMVAPVVASHLLFFYRMCPLLFDNEKRRQCRVRPRCKLGGLLGRVVAYVEDCQGIVRLAQVGKKEKEQKKREREQKRLMKEQKLKFYLSDDLKRRTVKRYLKTSGNALQCPDCEENTFAPVHTREEHDEIQQGITTLRSKTEKKWQKTQGKRRSKGKPRRVKYPDDQRYYTRTFMCVAKYLNCYMQKGGGS